MRSAKLCFAVCLFTCPVNYARADLIYRPINPSFGGDPFNSNHLQGLAGTQNAFKAESKAKTQSATDRFLSMLQSRLYSALAGQVADAIFGENAQPTGTITFDDQQVSFNNNGVEIEITILNISTGEVTNITVPTLTQ
jgi:curli production assembly/transport component CsgF